MLIIAIVLLVLWGIGLATTVTLGGFIHLFAVLAVLAILGRVILGRRVLAS